VRRSHDDEQERGGEHELRHGGWDKAAFGVQNKEIHLNACAWLLNSAPDTTPPTIVAGPAVAASDCSASVTWSTDEAATSIVDYLFRVLGVEYLQRYDFAQVPPTAAELGGANTDNGEAPPAEPYEGALPRGFLSYHPPPAEPHDTLRPGPEGSMSALDAQLEEMMGDAPVCDGCGHITVRNGACYKCLNCGNSMGCS